MIFMPPRHGKSELATKRFPSWFLGRNPGRQVIQASYNSDLARDFGRQVRNIFQERRFRNVFSDVDLAQDSKAADRWHTNRGGSYVAAGVGTAITGRGADILIIDDPLKDREEADSETRRDTVWNWYTSTAYTRLQGMRAEILVQCMTGDTPVLMANGAQKPLRDIRPGDCIATYENGGISTSTVRNWANQGPDRLFTIRMTSGITVRANARHPFLVFEDGKEIWQRTDKLKKGSVILRAIGANGRAYPAAQKDATSPPAPEACVCRTTIKSAGKTESVRHLSTQQQGVRPICAIGMESTCQIMSECLPNKAAFALSAGSPQAVLTQEHIGTESSVLITVTDRSGLEACCATIATLPSDTEKLKPSCLLPLSTYVVTHDTVEEIVEGGFEDVFDIQVDRTENFIANGLVSHNTRWHEDDLAGRLLAAEAKGGKRWEKLILPAIMSDGSALWPERFPLHVLTEMKQTMGPRDWSALYQQDPAPEDGTFFLKSWFHRHPAAPSGVHVYGCSDYAVTEGAGDYTEHGVFGVDAGGRIYQMDWWHGQTAADEWIERKLEMIRKWRPIAWFGEAGVIQKAIEPMLKRRMVETATRCRVEWLPSIHDKPTRARGFQSRAAMGEVSLLEDDRGDRVLRQLLSFPAGKHDDAVDVCSMIGRALDMAHPAIIPLVEAKARVFSDYRAKAQEADSWRV